jgi:cytochrome c-type biogenesis protein CcsB
MDSSFFFGISTMAYISAMMIYIAYLAFKNKTIGIVATVFTITGFILHTLAIISRWVEFKNKFDLDWLRSVPLTNLYESLTFFVWCLILGYLIIEFKFKNRSFGAFIMPIAGLTLAFIDVFGISKDIQPLVPALKSNWLLAHVTMSFIAYSAFAIASGTGLMYLISTTEKDENRLLFWIIFCLFTILFALTSQNQQTIPLWIASFAFVIATDVKLNIDIAKYLSPRKTDQNRNLLKTVLTVIAISLVTIAAIFVFIQLVKLQLIKADEAAKLKHLNIPERAPTFKGSAMGIVGLLFFISLVLVKYLVLRKEFYLFWTLTSGFFVVVLTALLFDVAVFKLIGVQIPQEESMFLRATFLNPSPIVVILTCIASIIIIYLFWRYGQVFKKIISAFKLSIDFLDDITYRMITIGFPIFTIGGLIGGAVWADRAWGTYWSWDPKETWSLILWFIYAFYLHSRMIKGWRGKKVAIVAVIGFMAVIFTYLGVNLLLSGLHAYGSD